MDPANEMSRGETHSAMAPPTTHSDENTDISADHSIEKEQSDDAQKVTDEKDNAEALAEPSKDEPPKHAEETRSKGRTAVIMFALGVSSIRLRQLVCHR